MDHQGQVTARGAFAHDVIGLGTVQAQGQAVGAGLELQGQDAHADEVGAVDALEALGGDGLDPRQAHALGRPVAGGALTIVRPGDDDQRLLTVHVGLDRLPHAHDLTLGLDPRQGPLPHLALGIPHHLVQQLGIGEGRALGGQMIAAMGGVGVKVLLRQAHLRQVLAGRAVEQDGVGRRQVVGGDVVPQDRQGAHAREGPLPGQGPLPIGRAADVGRLGPPGIERALGRLHRPQVEHGDVDLLELLRLDAGGDEGVDLRVTRPQVLEGDGVAVLILAQHIPLDIEADGAGEGVGHHQGRRGEEGLLGVGVDAAVEVAVAGQHGHGIEVAVDDLLLDLGLQGAGHAVAGSTGVGDDAKAQLL